MSNSTRPVSRKGSRVRPTPDDPYANAAPGTVAYAKSEGVDGIATYTPVIAQETYYQTPSGPARGIKWVTATASQAEAAGILLPRARRSNNPFLNVEPGTIAHIPSKSPSGVVTYTPVIAQESFGQTQSGPARRIEWVAATPSQLAVAGIPHSLGTTSNPPDLLAPGVLPSHRSSGFVIPTYTGSIPANQSPNEVVTSTMTCDDIGAILANHGCVDLTSSIDDSACSKYPITQGGLGDVFRGRLFDGTLVAIKTIRAYYDPGQHTRIYHKRAAKEIHTWSKCRHPNVVELRGFAIFHECIAMVSLWEVNGNLPHYLSRHPSADRCQMSTSICAGLAYLHDNDIVHGDLKGANVLISQSGTPMLMDFGNASLLESTLKFTQTNTGPNFSLRWTAPEILEGTSTYSTAGDVYSLGMTILETFTSEIPFADKPEKSLALHIVVYRNIPARPEKVIPKKSICGDRLWTMLTRCWSHHPLNRPSARVVWDEIKPITHKYLEKGIQGWRGRV